MEKSIRFLYLKKFLRFMARSVLRKYNPTVVGITGSVGKSSAKEAVALALAVKYKVRKNEKNYNNEIGIPLTIIGVETGGRSLYKWGLIFFRWLDLILFKKEYPEILVLEIGVDRPGDMDYLMGFIPVTVGVITNVSSSHLEFFKSVDHIAREKGKIFKNVPEHGMAILNADDEKNTLILKKKLKIPFLTFGFSEAANIRAERQAFNLDGKKIIGTYFQLNYEGKVIPVRLSKVVGEHFIYAALAAIAVGLYFKVNVVKIVEALENFTPPCGRMNLLAGIKNSFILDDTYNASPKSSIAALNTLAVVSGKRKIVVMGDMLELGTDATHGHEEVIKKVAEIKASLFFGIGKNINRVAEKAEKFGLSSEKIFLFNNLESLGRSLQAEIKDGDVILVKGSQGMRLEKVVEEIMAQPLEAEKKLCRQSSDWRARKVVEKNFT